MGEDKDNSIIFNVSDDRTLEIKITKKDICYSCGLRVSEPIIIQVNYNDGAIGMSFCTDCILKVKKGINKQLKEQKKNG